MKKIVDDRINVDSNNTSLVPKQKERRIVSWSQEEDDVLREQIREHGTENWAIIASKFEDKTTRQCRRRWFTYLNSDFKKGGWSPEEDMLLCEAQKIYGNRWTEIAKVVPGRTDNAVKNRFSTLCRKMAKREALTKGNSPSSYVKLNNKRVVSHNGFNEDGSPKSDEPIKRTRTCIRETFMNCEPVKLAGDCGGVAPQSFHICEVNNLPTEMHVELSSDGSMNTKIEGSFLNKDDPKVLALLQQAELLSSLAIKVNKEMTNQSSQDVWIVSGDHLKQNKEGDLLMMSSNSDTSLQLEKFKELRKDLKRENEGGRASFRETDAYESSSTSSEYSTGSTQLSDSPNEKPEEYEIEISMLHQEIGPESELDQLDHQRCLTDENVGSDASVKEVDNIVASDDLKGDDGAAHEYSYTEFSSPLHVTPLFRALAAAIPSPKFSESERHFLMKTLGMDSATPSPLTHTSQHPPCKRSLLRSL